jgi:hypothetical protein
MVALVACSRGGTGQAYRSASSRIYPPARYCNCRTQRTSPPAQFGCLAFFIAVSGRAPGAAALSQNRGRDRSQVAFSGSLFTSAGHRSSISSRIGSEIASMRSKSRTSLWMRSISQPHVRRQCSGLPEHVDRYSAAWCDCARLCPSRFWGVEVWLNLPGSSDRYSAVGASPFKELPLISSRNLPVET